MKSWSAFAIVRRSLLATLLCMLSLAVAANGQGRVVVLGVDGLDHELTRQMMERGELPALARLAGEGTFSALLPPNPAQSPVSWACLTTGRQPGGTRIYGFLRPVVRDEMVVPEPAMVERVEKPLLTTGLRWLGFVGAFLVSCLPLLLLRRRRRVGWLAALCLAAVLLLFLRWLFGFIPQTLTQPVNHRTGTALWEALDDEGIPVTTLLAPCAFPAPELGHGHLLCGLGVPDLLGTHGTVWVWMDDPIPAGEEVTQMGGRRLQLLRRPGSDHLTGGRLVGPPNPMTQEPMTVPVDLTVVEGNRVRLRYQGQDVTLERGGATALLPVRFTWSDVVSGVAGLVRFRLLDAGEAHVVYVDPIQMDPREQIPWAPITSTPEFGRELAEGGLFETAGWPCATNPYQDRLIDDAVFLADVETVVEDRHRLVMSQLSLDSWRVFFTVLSTPDRVQHMFWRDRDPDHPAHDAAAANRRGDVIADSYRRVDALVARIRDEVLRPDDALLVVSDHGFAPFRHAVNVNKWLASKGYLTIKPSAAPASRTLARDLGTADAFRDVDWQRTRAFHMGLGRIWINERGRWPGGIVLRGEKAALMEEIRKGLLELTHQGRSVVRSVATGEELYGAAREAPQEAPDLVLGFERGYRVSWSACLGGVDEPVIFPNRTRWSGDHCSVDPALVPGVIFSNKKLAAGECRVTDVYPTMRALLGLDPAAGLDGRSLLEKR